MPTGAPDVIRLNFLAIHFLFVYNLLIMTQLNIEMTTSDKFQNGDSAIVVIIE